MDGLGILGHQRVRRATCSVTDGSHAGGDVNRGYVPGHVNENI